MTKHDMTLQMKKRKVKERKERKRKGKITEEVRKEK